MSTERVRSAPIPNHQKNDLTVLPSRDSRDARKPLLSATLAEGSLAVKQTAYSLDYPVVTFSWAPADSHDDAAGLELALGFSPRWRKIEMVPLPLSTVTSPGSSISFVITRYSATENGPGLVR